MRLSLLRPARNAHAPGGDEPGGAPHQPADEERADPFAALALHVSDCRLARVICTFGDLLLDVVVRLDGPIAEDTDTYGRTRVGPGGQAANVAAWVAGLGGRARFLGKGATDPAGRMLADELRRRGVEVAGPEEPAGTGTVVSVATPDGKRTMLTDRGIAPTFSPEELEPGWLDGCEWLHVAGYSLARSPIREAALAAAELAPRVSVDLSSTAAIEAAGVEEFRAALTRVRPEIVFANEEEAALVGDVRSETLVLKRGAGGIVVDGVEHPARPAEVVDTTGAGDALAAGYLLGGPELGLDAAARCVATMGAFPP
jgi:sugar/nucleoside kinase (ribokinase family)